jgi:hypothetical protein
MKYLVMIYHNTDSWNALTQAEKETIWSEGSDLWKELTASGELEFGEPLASPGESRIVRLPNGLPVVTDGPFAEAKEQFVGFLILNVASGERAVELASRWPDARVGAMEVRRIEGANAA